MIIIQNNLVILLLGLKWDTVPCIWLLIKIILILIIAVTLEGVFFLVF
jgi:hypothetical protein